MYAIFESGGKQHRAQEGDVLRLERLEQEPGGTVSFERVLLVSDDEGVRVGRPVVEGAQVHGTVVEQGKGPKVIVFKKKRRKQYRRKNGHRQRQTVVRVDRIELG